MAHIRNTDKTMTDLPLTTITCTDCFGEQVAAKCRGNEEKNKEKAPSWRFLSLHGAISEI